MDLELVSLKTCPYVQRSVITLREKDVPFGITYIDLDDPPEWFRRDSPLGKVPILRTERGVLFESAVINEFVDEVTEGSLMPDDPWEKAQTRAWIEFGSECLVEYYQASMASTEADYERHREALVAKLERLDRQVHGPFFLGERFTLADAALAPLLMRLEEFEKTAPGFDFDHFPHLKAWKDALLARPSVAGSMVPEWRDLLRDYIARRDGFIGRRLQAA